MLLKKDAILAASDHRRETVAVPEWGGEVIVSTMSGAARDAWEMSLAEQKKGGTLVDVRAGLVVACVVDESGVPLFTAADIPALSQKSAAALDRVTSVAQRLNRIGEKELEDLKGN